MEIRWLSLWLILVVFQISVTDVEGQSSSPRLRSKFRPRGKPNNPFDQTQPQVPDNASQVSAVARRRIGSTNGDKGLNRNPENIGVRGGISKQSRIRINGNQKTAENAISSEPLGQHVGDSSAVAKPPTGGYKVVCYFTNWSQYRPGIGKFMPENLDPSLCTHINYAFAWLKKGRLTSLESNDESEGGKVGFYETITGLKKINPQLKVLLALGGWTFGTKRFRDMASDRYSRQTFIFSAIPFLRKHNFDGLDLDWEYPAGKNDKTNFNMLAKELLEAFDAESQETKLPRLLLTAAVAVGPDKVQGGYDIPTLSRYLDFINVMAYDFHGKWENTVGHNAPLYAPSTDSEWRKQLSVTYASELWHRLGAPKEKLIIGMPTYGRSFTLSNLRRTEVNSPSSGGGSAGKFTGEEGFLAYYEICQFLRSGAAYVWDEEMQVPYMVKDDLWVGFDDQRTIKNKMKWLKKEGYGGAMVWSLDMDDFSGTVCGSGEKYPLIGIMAEELLGRKRTAKDINWAAVATGSVARLSALPAPITFDPIQGIKAFLANSTSRTTQLLNMTPRDSPNILCYFTSWSNKRPGAGKFEATFIDPRLCTHVVYAFATLNNYKLSPGQATDVGDGFRKGTYEVLLGLKEKNPNLKIILAVGGWALGSKPFQDLTSNPFRMNGFVYDALEFLRRHSLDGLDIHWEYPKGADDKANYAALLRELRVAFEGEAKATGHSRLLLSAAVPASFEAMHAGYDVPEISKYLDFINVMTYDFHGKWENVIGHNSPLFPLQVASSHNKKLTVDYSVRAWIKEGAPPQKLLVGMPMYGRSFTLANETKFDISSATVGGGKEGRYTEEKGFLSYYEVCDFLYQDNTTLVWDNEQQVPFAYKKDQWVGFDDERSLKLKVEWLKEFGLGGAMVWSVDMDDFRGNCGDEKYPLLRSLVSAFGNYTVELTYDGPYENTGTLHGKSIKKDPNEVICEETAGHISYHADAADCTRYYMCEGERKHHMPCPQNLVFNPLQNVCDWPENVEGCGASKSADAKR